MNSGLFFALGTLAVWAGSVFAFQAIVALFRIVFSTESRDLRSNGRTVLVSSLAGAALLVVGGVGTRSEAGAFRFPLVWFVMPWTAWLGFACLAMAIARLIQTLTAINAEEQRSKSVSLGAFLIAAFVFAVLYFSDKSNKIEILKGGILLHAPVVAGIILALIATTAAMVYAARFAAGRGLAKMLVSQITLMVGCVVFGLPFAFLVITSFKEDRDMSSKEGIVWIPKVQDTIPFKDPKNPKFEAIYEGKKVVAGIISKKGDTALLDIQKPLAIRGITFEAKISDLKEVPTDAQIFSSNLKGTPVKGFVVENLDDGRKTLQIMEPQSLKGEQHTFMPAEVEPVRHVGLRVQNYSEALDFLPPETNGGLVYLKNTLILVILNVIGTLSSSAIVAYAFSRMQFPGRDNLFRVLLATMMLPGAVTLLPQFLIFRTLGWIDSLYPLWVPAFFGSAFNIFLLQQFFKQIPMELEDAAKIDGCNYVRTFWSIMIPQIKPALAVIAIWTFMGSWNNFMGPLIYVNSPENMPLSYALQLFQGDRYGEPGLLMAFATLTILPVLALFFFAQKYFIEGLTLSGLGGR